MCSGSDDCSVAVWDVDKGNCLHRLEGTLQSVTCVHLSLNFGRVIVSCGCWDGTIHKWTLDAPPGASIIKSTSGVTGFGIANAEREVEESALHHLNRVTCVCPIYLTGDIELGSSSVGHHLFATSSLDGCIRIWSLQRVDRGSNFIEMSENLSCIAVLNCDRFSAISFITQLADGRLAILGLESSIVIYPFYTNDIVKSLKSGSCVSCVLSSVKCADSRVDSVIIKGLPSRVTVFTSIVGNLNKESVELLITGSDDCLIRLYSTQSGKCVLTLDGHLASITCIQSLSDGRLVTGSDDGSVLLWNLNAQHNGDRLKRKQSKPKNFVTLLHGKHAIRAIIRFKPTDSTVLSPVGTVNVQMQRGIQLCLVTADGCAHMRRVDLVDEKEVERNDTNGKAFLSGKQMSMLHDKYVLSESDVLPSNDSAYLPGINRLLSKGSLYGIIDNFTFVNMIGHEISDTITIGYSLSRNILVCGTSSGKVYAFKVFSE